MSCFATGCTQPGRSYYSSPLACPAHKSAALIAGRAERLAEKSRWLIEEARHHAASGAGDQKERPPRCAYIRATSAQCDRKATAEYRHNGVGDPEARCKQHEESCGYEKCIGAGCSAMSRRTNPSRTCSHCSQRRAIKEYTQRTRAQKRAVAAAAQISAALMEAAAASPAADAASAAREDNIAPLDDGSLEDLLGELIEA